jgi:4'-phosphopantetheinyl transferase
MKQDNTGGWSNAPEMLPGLSQEVHVWRTALDLSEVCLHRLWQALDSEERERANRFHFAKDRDHFIAARGRLRAILSRYLQIQPRDLRFVYGARGKPSLAGQTGGLRFNLAHSHGLALYAIAEGREVGIDVEFIRPSVAGEGIAERFFSRLEVAALRSLPPTQRQVGFFTCWTRKEAFLKAHGEGLGYGLNQFSVSVAPDEPAALVAIPSDPEAAAHWSLQDLAPGPGYVAALAVERPLGNLRCWRYLDE